MSVFGSAYKRPAYVALAISMACAHMAHAANTQTINTSDASVDPDLSIAFTPAFVDSANSFCSSPAGTSSGNCNSYGSTAVSAAAGLTPTGYFNNPTAMPPQINNNFNDALLPGVGFQNAQPFSSGLLEWDRLNGNSYFAGLSNAWTTYNNAAANGTAPMGVPELAGDASSTLREHWIDQTVVSWVETLETGGTPIQALNFRSQLSWAGANALGPGSELISYAHIDQRMEQLLLLDGLTGAAFNASKQTLQSAFAVNSNTGSSISPNGTGAGGSGTTGQIGVDPLQHPNTSGLGQMVTQDISGWFTSCLNCDRGGSTTSYAFTPMEQSLTFMPFTSSWEIIPTVVHGGRAQ